jgi:hypothetical protein
MLGTLLLLLSAQASSAPSAEQTAIFKAAGFTRQGAAWKSGNCDGTESASYKPGRIETYRDLNGDGRPDALVFEGGAVCYGMTGMHFWLLSKQANGGWKRIHDETAMPEFLKTTGVGGWPDIQMGGPGFCFLVARWNGKAYVKNRFEYEGRACKP